MNALARTKAAALQQHVSLSGFAMDVTHNGTCVFFDLDRRPFGSVWENMIFPSFLAAVLWVFVWKCPSVGLKCQVGHHAPIFFECASCSASPGLRSSPVCLRVQPCMMVPGLPAQVLLRSLKRDAVLQFLSLRCSQAGERILN